MTMMKRVMLAAAVAWAWMVAGCGDPVDRLLANGDLRPRLWVKVAERSELADELVDRLLSADSTRAALIDRVMASGGARQALLTRVAQDRTLMDGAINFAVQDSSMRDHLMSLFRGMQMVGAQ